MTLGNKRGQTLAFYLLGAMSFLSGGASARR